MYNKIKKEHLFIFLALFTTLVLFTYFEEFEYTGLTTKGICEEKGYQCCNQGEGANHFSLDYSCSNNQQCWDSCIKEENNLVTGSVTAEEVWNPIKNFFKKLFSKDVIAGIHTDLEECPEDEPDLILSFEDGHASLNYKYSNIICSNEIEQVERGGEKVITIARDESHVSRHVDQNNNKSYENTLIISSENENLNVYHLPSCKEGDTPLFSIDSLYNTHIGSPNEFDINVCYGFDINNDKGKRGRRNILCDPGIEIIDCDTGLKGICKAGTQRCNRLGTGFESCNQLNQPIEEILDDDLDNDCDGLVNETTETTSCGDEIKQTPNDNNENEECDTNDFGNTPEECGLYDPLQYSGGILTCTESCEISTESCEEIQETTYTLRVNNLPRQGGLVTPTTQTYNEGDRVVLTANPIDDFTFSRWSGDASGTRNPIRFIMNDNKRITAHFQIGTTVQCETASDCPDNTCYEPTCRNNLCNQGPVPQGQMDESCISPNSCDGLGNCVDPQAEPEDCTNSLADRDNDGIKAAFDLDCVDNFNNYLEIIEVVPSNDEPYTLTDIEIDCNYNILDENGEDKTLSFSTERYIGSCIESYIISPNDNSQIYCNEEETTTSTRNDIVSFKECYTGENPGEEVAIICSVKDECIAFSDLGTKEEFIDLIEYEYCSELTEGAVELIDGSIRLGRANEAGEELKITGKVTTDEESIIIVEAALISLQNDRILEETLTEIDYEEAFEEEKFELTFDIPSVKKDTYFIYIKAYIDNEESSTCTQLHKTINIKSDIDDEDEGNEFSCTDGIDNDNNGLVDCEDRDCEGDASCSEICIEGERCITGLPGICSTGTKTCTDDILNECVSLIEPNERQEICNNNLDDNCNGDIDENCEGLGDGDNLPDSWEIDYFGNLLQEDYNDYDGDGISNLEEYREGTDPTVSNKKTGSLLWLWATLGIILLGAIIFFVFKLLKKPKSRGGIIDPRLKSYVQSSLRKGFTKNQIKQALITKGWSQSDINKVLK